MIDIVERAMRLAGPAGASGIWADVGTGSGALALGLATKFPGIQHVRSAACYYAIAPAVMRVMRVMRDMRVMRAACGAANSDWPLTHVDHTC